ncbi:MAG: hypothetical protein NT039_01370 [Candidatus Berkelbacteria bacterium]|nr:hypothetical protein [Candidatus Berkelbacteria bacterium]
MAEEKSEKNKEIVVEKHHPNYHFKPIEMILIAVIIVLIAGVSFAFGRISAKRGNEVGRSVPAMNQFYGRGFSGIKGERIWTGGRIRNRETSGEIIKIDGDNLAVSINSKELTVVISDNTSIRNQDEILKKSDLKVGDNISIVGPSDAYGQIQAETIIINN